MHMQERRASRRLPRSEKTTVNTAERNDHSVELIDISTGGMRLRSREAIPLGTQVSSQLKIAPQVGGFHVQGTVAWCKPAADGSGYEVGVTFTKVNAKHS